MFFSFKKIIKSFFRTIFKIVIILVIAGIIVTTLYPLHYKDYINKYSSQYGLDPFLVAAVINVESKFQSEAVSSKNAKGLMQITDQTGKWGFDELNMEAYSEESLFQPETNIRIGTWYLNQLNKEFDDNQGLVLAAYNAGSGNVRKWLADESISRNGVTLDNIPFTETKEYIKKVNNNYKIYKVIYQNYMEKDENINPLYMDLVIKLRASLKEFLNELRNE